MSHSVATQSAHDQDYDLSRWLSETRELLQVEWDEEQQVAVSELDAASARSLERRGVSVLRLQVDNVESGLFGKTKLTFTKYRGAADSLIAAEAFGVGDIVRVLEQSSVGTSSDVGEAPSGVVSRLTESSISVAIGDSLSDDQLQALRFPQGALRMDKLPNDATHKRAVWALNDLEHAAQDNNAHSAQIIRVLFGGQAPRQEARFIRGERNVVRAVDSKGDNNLKAGSFEDSATGEQGNNSTDVLTAQELEEASLSDHLNDSQRRSVSMGLRTRDVALIHGPPGTGKTTAVVELIAKAVQLGNRVLVCAPSNVAIDNIVVRLAEKATLDRASGGRRGKQRCANNKQQRSGGDPGFPMRLVRLGHPARLLPQVLEHSLDAMLQRSDETAVVKDAKEELENALGQLYGSKGGNGKGKASGPTVKGKARGALRKQVTLLRKEIRQRERDAVRRLVAGCNVVCSTTVGAAGLRRMNDQSMDTNPALFDLVVIDEAAQGIEATCWIPILMARRVVLAGDHLQLPPTIKSNKAMRGILGVTMFDRIMRMHGSKAAHMLDTQYRMNTQIMQWSSDELYDSNLKAHTSVAQRTLDNLEGFSIDKIGVKEGDEGEEEGAGASSRALGSAVLALIDTAGCGMEESEEDDETGEAGVSGQAKGRQRGSKYNEGEAKLVVEHVDRLIRGGLSQHQMAVVTPYNAQVHLIRSLLRETHPLIEVRSVDGFQGREKDAIVLSLVRSNGTQQVGFLSDHRRLNVAITRAKRHVCVICDTDTVAGSSSRFLERMVGYFEQHAVVHCVADDQGGVVSGSYRDRGGGGSKVVNKVKRGKNVKLSDERKRELRAMVEKVAVVCDADTNGSFNGSIEVGGEHVLEFPHTLTASERFEVHEVATELGLMHVSVDVVTHVHDEGNPKRQVRVWCPSSAAQIDKVSQQQAAQIVPRAAGAATKVAREVLPAGPSVASVAKAEKNEDETFEREQQLPFVNGVGAAVSENVPLDIQSMKLMSSGKEQKQSEQQQAPPCRQGIEVERESMDVALEEQDQNESIDDDDDDDDDDIPTIAPRTALAAAFGSDSSDSDSSNDSDNNDSDSGETNASGAQTTTGNVPDAIQEMRAMQQAKYLASKAQASAKGKKGKAKPMIMSGTTNTACAAPVVKPPAPPVAGASKRRRGKGKGKKKAGGGGGGGQAKADSNGGPIVATATDVLLAKKATIATTDGLDDEMALLDQLVLAQGKCVFIDHSNNKSKACKTSTKTMGVNCKLCNLRYCYPHSQPEVHGCGSAASASAREEYLRGWDGDKMSKEKRAYVKKALGDKIISSAEGRMSQEAQIAAANAPKRKKKKKDKKK